MKKFVICFLIFVCYLFLGAWTFAAAMGGSPPKKEEPKYKLEILKIDIITTPSPSKEAKHVKKT